MEFIAALPDVAIGPALVEKTRGAFAPELEARRAEIQGVPKKTFAYGPTPRHQLDIYYPSAPATNAPVLFIIYGGGLHAGERSFPAPHDLTFANVGAFFTKQGFVTVVPDYRLVPTVTFPQPAEDVRDAIAWVAERAASGELTHGSVAPDASRLFVLAHSAGAVLASTMLLHAPTRPPPDLLSRIRGVVLSSGPFRYDPARPVMAPPILAHYHPNGTMLADMPVALLARADDATVGALPDTFLLLAEKEPDALREAVHEFRGALEARLGKPVKLAVMKDHNHISPQLALTTGKGEEWAYEVAEWLKARN